MNTYKVKLKSDSGLHTVTILADSEHSAKERVTNIEGAPLCAVKSVKMVKTAKI